MLLEDVPEETASKDSLTSQETTENAIVGQSAKHPDNQSGPSKGQPTLSKCKSEHSAVIRRNDGRDYEDLSAETGDINYWSTLYLFAAEQ